MACRPSASGGQQRRYRRPEIVGNEQAGHAAHNALGQVSLGTLRPNTLGKTLADFRDNLIIEAELARAARVPGQTAATGAAEVELPHLLAQQLLAFTNASGRQLGDSLPENLAEQVCAHLDAAPRRPASRRRSEPPQAR
jgi:hypothetical protein